MKLTFPDDFLFGTGTAAYQIETAFEHDWQGIKARDGNVFNRTTDHERSFKDDVKIIADLASNYRMSLMWSKLQRAPFAPLDNETVVYYHHLLSALRSHHVRILMVLHHFANPLWFSKLGGWEKPGNVSLWCDYAKKVVDEFGDYVDYWNTFNEPNLYASLGWIFGEFPPGKRNIFSAYKVIKNISIAHSEIYRYIKKRHCATKVGISHNCTIFSGYNLTGRIPAAVFDWCFMDYATSLFRELDFFGMSYYAKIDFDPLPITYLNTPEKIRSMGKNHDEMWEYYPQGLSESIRRFWNKYKLPILVTENGICTSDDSKRVRAIHDYMRGLAQCLSDGIPILGYYHWSTWDNFEWNLGPSYKFGLYECDFQDSRRRKKASADVYSKLAFNKEIFI